MNHARASIAALSAAVAFLAGGTLAPTPPEPPTAASGDAVAGAEPAGVDAGEWEALMRGSESAAVGVGGLQALLDSDNLDLVAFYKNLNRSLSADEDDAYHVYARRCGQRALRTEQCAPEDLVYDHVVFTRTATPDGGFDFEVLSVVPERPVGTLAAGVAALNPFGAPHVAGPVTIADRDEPRRDPTALADLASEVAAATDSVVETGPAPEVGVERFFNPVEHTTYPYPYSRIAAQFDDSDAGDLIYSPTPSGDKGPRSNHGALNVTQSRSTVLVAGRGARRTAFGAGEEEALELQNVDIAATVAKVLGVGEHPEGQHFNNGDASSNPAAHPPLLRRMDGRPVEALLEPRVNTFVIVIDGMIPENVTAAMTPNLCNLIACPNAALPDPETQATVYEQARALMVTQTNANHAAMVTGAYGDASGLIGNSYYNRASATPEELERPGLLRVDTLFDAFRAHAPQAVTAGVFGKEKLRSLLDCTNSGTGSCIPSDADNPEGVAVSHVRPDFLRGASTSPEPGDCPVVHASVPAPDACVMDIVIELSATEDPDFTFVNLGSVDIVQHGDGPGTPGAFAAIAEADHQIARLVGYLKDSGKWKHSVLIVTADHSFSLEGPPPGQRIDLTTVFEADRSAFPGLWGAGLTEPYDLISNGGAAHLYLTDLPVGATSLSAAQEAALARMRTLTLEQTGISEAWYRFDNSLDVGNHLDAQRPDWHLNDQRAGDLLITALASGPNGLPGNNPFEVPFGPGYVITEGPEDVQASLPGDHGHPGVRHIPFMILSGGDFVVDQIIAPSDPGAVNEGDDTAALPEQAENVDIAATVAWVHGLIDASASDATAILPASSGRVLAEAFAGGVPPIEVVEPHANRALIFLLDGNNSVRVHDFLAQEDGGATTIPAIRSLLLRPTDARSDSDFGLLTDFGSISGYPSTSFPNHNTVGNGVNAGHHGVVGNRYYERDIETERDPVDVTDPRNPVTFTNQSLLRDDMETLHEAVHRSFGDWHPATNPDGAFTASANEPSARGADFASTELVASENVPIALAALATDTQFLNETSFECVQEAGELYGGESAGDHAGTRVAISMYEEPTFTPTSIPGVSETLIDTTGGANHPDPKYLIINYALTDGGQHAFGPHSNCGKAGFLDTDQRVGRVLAALRDHSRFANDGEPARLGETFIVLTGDHGHENQDERPGKNGGFDDGPTAADIEYVRQNLQLYLLTLDVDIQGAPGNLLPAGQPAALTFTVTDGDLRDDGGATPVEGALVAASWTGGSVGGLTDSAGQVILNFTPSGDSVQVVVDKDVDPAQGGRTLGSEDPDPNSHGVVSKQSYNDRVITLPEPAALPGWILGGLAVWGAARRRKRN